MPLMAKSFHMRFKCRCFVFRLDNMASRDFQPPIEKSQKQAKGVSYRLRRLIRRAARAVLPALRVMLFCREADVRWAT
ncbi:hypothetical protein [Ciceribacter ferrooxidans]|uniref:Uncharacterized protein n=1 Tax=Ciceribacter ferrooxidans TaxID=2509717 RepID=A0A4Q2T0W9_9HYPH|nr:hypothetical protein [Ciceribacter ferrooxidans]RYC12266.1 hypothetical protein EUU22_14570 [Ciceribacter ferrooxidans]